ncbi:BTAD domain-containing putative transcriptional regulator [Nonomuraea basaltis]|uniref:BTAD domain-containing putative transcriptional regulator n=1 Tax=Nonomuraea basaltis TaxID=2495887 RepID=UPI00110C60A7|nr:BTAD domain-containing putative transcriptional regulator [Nonomuraea basaltis]TMR95621.1 AfsR/SARP family transcriptional regulator [Nonomuraea basaltis]
MAHPKERPAYRVLGTLEVAGTTASALGSARQRALLACLLAQDRHWASADVLADVLWGDAPPRHPAAALHTQVSRLREVLRRAGRTDEVMPEQRGYRLVVDRSDVDAWRFETLLRHAGSVPVGERAGAYERALSLWRGRAFEEIADHPAVQLTATRLEELRLAAVEDRAAALISAGDLGGVIAELTAFAAVNPLRERALELLMTALYRSGRQSDALAVFEDYRVKIAEELGLDPTPPLRALQLDILNQTVPAVRQTATVSRPPVPLSRLIGRDKDLRRLTERIREHRLLTVVGPGGVGKTRLVTQALPALDEEFADGVWWCDLSVITSGALQAVASVLGVVERSDVPLEWRLREFLAGRRCVVVLDNCEHLAVEAAHVAELLATSSPGVRTVATSREALGVDGERLFTVDPLAVDGESSAVVLFLDRARAHDVPLADDRATRDTVAAICRRLDGLPLAIELAAARTRSLSVEEILQQLQVEGSAFLSNPRRTASERHQDMLSVVDWSYRLLGQGERTLLQRLSVFAGSFDRVAANAVGAGGEVRRERLDAVLGGLVDKSLVVVGREAEATRYRLLESVREYGGRRLVPSGERQTRERHARHYIETVRRADRLLWGPEERQGQRVIDGDLAELRAAHGFLRDAGDIENLLALSAPLIFFLSHRSRSEMYRWAETAIGFDTAASHPDFAAACGQAAYGAWQRGDRARAAELVARGLHEGCGNAGHLHRLASQLALFDGRMEDCVRDCELAHDAFAEDGQQGWAETSRLVSVLAHAYHGDMAAEAMARRLRERMGAWGAPSMVGWSEFALGEALQARDLGEALACFDRAVAAAASVGASLIEGVARVAALGVHVRHGSAAQALTMIPPLLDHWARGGVWHQQWLTLRLLVEAYVATGEEHAAWRAAALLGAHDVSPTAGPVYGEDVARLDRVRERLHGLLGAERYAKALRHGAGVGDQGALTLARSLLAT